MEKKTINLLLFHGSAREVALKSAESFTQKLQRKGDFSVACCFLRGQQPDLATALRHSIKMGFRHIRIIQLFLLPGAHVNEDIPGIAAGFQEDYPDLFIETTPCLVELEEFAEMLLKILQKDD